MRGFPGVFQIESRAQIVAQRTFWRAIERMENVLEK
jgi:hypothetical protein